MDCGMACASSSLGRPRPGYLLLKQLSPTQPYQERGTGDPSIGTFVNHRTTGMHGYAERHKPCREGHEHRVRVETRPRTGATAHPPPLRLVPNGTYTGLPSNIKTELVNDSEKRGECEAPYVRWWQVSPSRHWRSWNVPALVRSSRPFRHPTRLPGISRFRRHPSVLRFVGGIKESNNHHHNHKHSHPPHTSVTFESTIARRTILPVLPAQRHNQAFQFQQQWVKPCALPNTIGRRTNATP
jgi:hypothetical protein